MFEKEADFAETKMLINCNGDYSKKKDYKKGWLDGAEFGYNKAEEEIQEKKYSLFDFVMQYENGKFKCKYKSEKAFESVDGETWKEIVLPVKTGKTKL